ncbi:MAG: hypothetical protein ABSD38_17625 [Syntrophorhabdales bacterium]
MAQDCGWLRDGSTASQATGMSGITSLLQQAMSKYSQLSPAGGGAAPGSVLAVA